MERDDRPALVVLLVTILINSVAAFVTEAVPIRNFLLISAAACAAYYVMAVWLIPRLMPRRFANLVFVLDDEGNMVVINHSAYNKLNPPGSRLSVFEAPHDAIGRVMRDELGLEDQPGRWLLDETIHPSTRALQIRIAPRPFQVQVEPGKHRRRVREHVDFVYVCRLPGIRPPLGSTKFSPMWISYIDFSKLPAERRFADVPDTYTRILLHLGARDRGIRRPARTTPSIAPTHVPVDMRWSVLVTKRIGALASWLSPSARRIRRRQSLKRLRTSSPRREETPAS